MESERVSAERLDEEDRERVRERERGEVSVRRFFPSPGAFFSVGRRLERKTLFVFSVYLRSSTKGGVKPVRLKNSGSKTGSETGSVVINFKLVSVAKKYHLNL